MNVLKAGPAMFDSLDEEIKAAEGPTPTQGERLIRVLAIVIITLLVFGAVVTGIILLES